MSNPSKTSPKGGKRGCLCPNGTYSSECCNGELIAQGIGATEGGHDVVLNQNLFERSIERSSDTPDDGFHQSTITHLNTERNINSGN